MVQLLIRRPCSGCLFCAPHAKKFYVPSLFELSGQWWMRWLRSFCADGRHGDLLTAAVQSNMCLHLISMHVCEGHAPCSLEAAFQRACPSASALHRLNVDYLIAKKWSDQNQTSWTGSATPVEYKDMDWKCT